MNSEATMSLVAAAAGLVGIMIGSLVTLYVSARNYNLEREKFDKQASVWEAEIAKLKLESQEKIKESLELKRNELKDLLVLFDRASFHPIDYDGDPTAVINGIRETRVALQVKRASFIKDENIAQKFSELQEILLKIEAEFSKEFPEIFSFALELADDKVATEMRLKKVRNKFDDEKLKPAVAFARTKAVEEIRPKVKDIKEELKKLNELLNKLELLF